MSGKTETKNKVDDEIRFANKIWRCIDGETKRSIEDGKLTYCEMIGVLETIKHDLLTEQHKLNEEEPEEEETISSPFNSNIPPCKPTANENKIYIIMNNLHTFLQFPLP